jgi:hypothetical protein
MRLIRRLLPLILLLPAWLLGGGCAAASSPPAEPDQGTAMHDHGETPMSPDYRDAQRDLDARLRRIWEAQSERVPTMRHPTRVADGTWLAPDDRPITQVVQIGWTRPPEQDGVPFTAYLTGPHGRFWVHEGGGISGHDRWYGPFDLPE